MTEKLNATVTNTGRVWQVTLEGIEGSTLVRSPSHAAEMAAELAAIHHGGSPADYKITVRVAMPQEWRDQYETVQHHRAEQERHRIAWRHAARSLVTSMRDDGLSQADVAASLGVSVQTVRTWEALEEQGEQ